MRLFRTTLLPLLILLAALFVSIQKVHAQSSNQAGLVVEFGDGSLYTGCIAFDSDSISGYDLLTRSGLSLETAIDPNQGIAICKIESDGCPADDCFCQMPEYWSYWNWVEGSWSYAGSGSSLNRVSDGDVDGWSWGNGSPPPAVPFNQLCAPPPPPPTETPPPLPTPTETPEPQPSDTPEPEPTDTFTPPTYTAEPSHTAIPDSPTPSPGTTRRITATASTTNTLTAEVSEESSAEPTKKSINAVNTSEQPVKKTPTSSVIRVSDSKAKAKDGNNTLIGYAIFGALLIGLGLTLTRIILKGRKQ